VTGAALTEAEATTLSAVHARLIPTDDAGPGATEAQVPRFVERALGGALAPLRDRYRSGLAALDSWSRTTRSTAFAELEPAAQEDVLRELENGIATGFDPSSRAFFDLMRLHAIQGMFSDPAHGGNAGEVGWDLIGFPGLKHGYSDEEQQLDVPVPRVRGGC
jgi:gluconate 2-dehydrogenase gamma chain